MTNKKQEQEQEQGQEQATAKANTGVLRCAQNDKYYGVMTSVMGRVNLWWRLAGRRRRCACSRCSGRGFRRGLLEFAPWWGAGTCRGDGGWRGSCLEYRCRTGLRLLRENIVGWGGVFLCWPHLRW